MIGIALYLWHVLLRGRVHADAVGRRWHTEGVLVAMMREGSFLIVVKRVLSIKCRIKIARMVLEIVALGLWSQRIAVGDRHWGRMRLILLPRLERILRMVSGRARRELIKDAGSKGIRIVEDGVAQVGGHVVEIEEVGELIVGEGGRGGVWLRVGQGRCPAAIGCLIHDGKAKCCGKRKRATKPCGRVS